MTIPTQLTVARIAAIPVMAAIFFAPWPWAREASAIIFMAAAFTDWLDGYLARRMQVESRFGAFLDPVADKLIVAAALVCLLQDDPRGVVLVPVMIIISREITISALREWMAELGQRTSVAVNWLGKFKTGTQMSAISMMLWRDPLLGLPIYELGFLCLILASALTMWSMVIYLRAAWPLFFAEVDTEDAKNPLN